MENAFFGCKGCEEYKTCKKPCPAIEAVLPKPRGGIRGGDITFVDPLVLDKLGSKEAGKRKKPHIYGDNWE